MAVVQSIPSGYLSLLGIKQGTNPGQAADYVTPTVALDTFYLATAIDSERATAVGVNAEGSQATLTVPSTEAWRLLAVSFNVVNVSAPATVVMVSIQISEPTSGFPVAVMPEVQSQAGAAGDSIFSGICFPQPVVVPPGTTIRSYLNSSIAPVTIDLHICALFQRFTV